VTATCVHVACDRPQRARTLCEMHYGQLKRSGLGPLIRQPPRQAKGVQLRAQLGENTACVDCGAVPWGGGMRCWDHFKERVRNRESEVARTSTPHVCTRHEPSVTCYTMDRCRCHGCRQAKADYAADREAA
jgi:hypothetical protein